MICELLPGVTWPHGRSKAGLSLASVSALEFGPHAVVVVEYRAVAREGRLQFAGEMAGLLRRREPLLALGRILIGLPAGDVKQMGDELRGLSHVEVGDRIGQPALQADDRFEK